jgi:hypothetical protein
VPLLDIGRERSPDWSNNSKELLSIGVEGIVSGRDVYNTRNLED